MDVHCLSCGEPWDTHHLLHDAIHETGLNEPQIQRWQTLSGREKLSEEFLRPFSDAGYRFGGSFLHLSGCPCCPSGSRPNPDRSALAGAIVEILGDDDDAIAVTFEEYGF